MERILLTTVTSTNDHALKLLERERPPEGTVVQALEQTGGRGMGGTRWSSERGKNLTLSVILYPVFLLPRQQFRLTQAIALAARDCVAQAAPGAHATIKWPNDILLEGRKVAGILPESKISGSSIVASVVGIGLNVNQTAFPQGLERAVSLALSTGVAHDLETVLLALMEHIQRRYEQLKSRPEEIDPSYRARLQGLGVELPYRTQGGDARGTIVGVDEEGRLLVRGSDGVSYAYRFKEIDFLGSHA